MKAGAPALHPVPPRRPQVRWGLHCVHRPGPSHVLADILSDPLASPFVHHAACMHCHVTARQARTLAGSDMQTITARVTPPVFCPLRVWDVPVLRSCKEKTNRGPRCSSSKMELLPPSPPQGASCEVRRRSARRGPDASRMSYVAYNMPSRHLRTSAQTASLLCTASCPL
jgi:hypothetical protein